MAVRARYFTDPLCPRSWALEPMLRLLEVRYAGSLAIEPVAVGLFRDPPSDASAALERARDLLEAAKTSGMPVDPRVWIGREPIRSSHPACLAVHAAVELDRARVPWLLRRLREAALCEQQRVDGVAALCELAAAVGYERERFARALESNATLERFGAAIEEGRAAQARAGSDHPTPLFEFDLGDRKVVASASLSAVETVLAQAGVAAGRIDESPAALLRRFRSLTASELASCLDLPLPRAHAELWAEVLAWRAQPVAVAGGGFLFRAA